MKTAKLILFLLIVVQQPIIKVNKSSESQQEVKLLAFTPKKNIDIQKVMNYQMPQIIERYCKDYKVSANKAALHEVELKRFLIVAAEDDPETTDMFSKEVDNLWHTFLLFTHEYQEFCQEMFGKFMHHCPTVNHEKIS